MRYNKYIRQGYRINFDSYSKLFKSLFMLHNETINVWTHIIGMIIFFYLIRHTFANNQPSEFYYKTIGNNTLDFGVSRVLPKSMELDWNKLQ